MRQSERAARESDHQCESDHQRWADDGGFTPDSQSHGAQTLIADDRFPWSAVGIATALGFALGWLTGRR